MSQAAISTQSVDDDEEPGVDGSGKLKPESFSFVNERGPDGYWVGYFRDFPGIRHTSRSSDEVYSVVHAALAIVLDSVQDEFISSKDLNSRESQLNIRMTGYEQALLRHVSQLKGVTLSEFARTAMMKEAVLQFLDHSDQ